MTKELLTFVTGYFGAPIREEAGRIASSKGGTILDLDALIEQKDGRTIARLCMMAGEHAYRNAEYEAVGELEKAAGEFQETAAPQVIACGDGILYDDDSRALILKHELIIAGEDLPLEELWARAKEDTATYHAFMKFGTEEEKRARFEDHHERQKKLFQQVRAEMQSAE